MVNVISFRGANQNIKLTITIAPNTPGLVLESYCRDLIKILYIDDM